MRGIESPDLDTTSALRQVGATVESFSSFQTVRSLPGSASAAFSFGTHALRPASGAQGDSYFATDRGWLSYYSGTAWQYEAGVWVGTDAVRAAVVTPTVSDVGGLFFATDTLALWRVTSAPAWAKLLEIKGTANQITAAIAAGVLTLSLVASPDVATGYKVAGTAVVGAQGATVADAAGGATVDAEARTAINALLARMRAHGLIAT